MKKFSTVIACKRNRFDFWNSWKRLQNFVNVEALPAGTSDLVHFVVKVVAEKVGSEKISMLLAFLCLLIQRQAARYIKNDYFSRFDGCVRGMLPDLKLQPLQQR